MKLEETSKQDPKKTYQKTYLEVKTVVYGTAPKKQTEKNRQKKTDRENSSNNSVCDTGYSLHLFL